jgi:two-component system chemotaxis response regulator CheB
MPKTRILIVDDSVVVRRLLSEALSTDPELEIAGTASNGKIALAKIPQVNPDLITLDIEMPELNGLETLAGIRKISARLPVIMFSTLTDQGAAATMEALTLGANDYVTKPSNVGNINLAIQRIREELIPKIKALCAKSSPSLTRREGLPSFPSAVFRNRASQPGNVEALVIGVSTGGPNALAEFMPQLPAGFPVPVLIVQHMPPMFTKALADRLSSICSIPVREAVAGELLQPAKAWVAPGNYHLALKREVAGVRVLLHQGPPENSCRPAVDVLFRSAAEVYGPAVLGVVLTGMGQDGLRGSQAIVETGGQVMAQDEASSVVWGMPGAVAKAGLASQILPLNQIGREVNRAVARHRKMHLLASPLAAA